MNTFVKFLHTIFSSSMLACLLLLASCMEPLDDFNNYKGTSHKGNTEWLFLIYIAADNDLEGNAYADLGSMVSSPINEPSKIRIIALVDYLGENNSYLFEVVDGDLIKLDSSELGIQANSPSEIDTGEGETLSQFLAYSRSNYTSDHCALFMWDHGTGWSRSKNTDKRSIAIDETSQHMMGNDKMQQALKDSNLDLIVFDACVMGMAEVAYELRKPVTGISYAVFSEDLVPLDGIPYRWIIDEILMSQEPYSPKELTTVIIDSYFGFYKWLLNDYFETENMDMYDQLTFSAIDLSKIEDVITKLNATIPYLEEQKISDLDSARANAQSYYFGEYVDLIDFVSYFDNPIIDELKESITNAVIANKTGEFRTASKGLSINFTTKAHHEEYNGENNTLHIDFLDACTWDDFLQSREFGYTIDTSEPENDKPNSNFVNNGSSSSGYLLGYQDFDYFTLVTKESGSFIATINNIPNDCTIRAVLYSNTDLEEELAIQSSFAGDTTITLNYEELKANNTYHFVILTTYGIDLNTAYTVKFSGTATY